MGFKYVAHDSIHVCMKTIVDIENVNRETVHSLRHE